MHQQRQRLDVQDDVGDIFQNAGDRAEFMQHAFDLDRCDGRALQRRQQDPPKRIAERQTKTALQRLDDHRRLAFRVGARFGDEAFRLNKFGPVFLNHFVRPQQS